MQTILVATMLAAGPGAIESFESFDDAVAAIAAEAHTGTLLFSRGDCLAVKVFTNSPYTHVAAVVVRDGEPWVYDSMSGIGVRRQQLAVYLKAERPCRFHLVQPMVRFTRARTHQFITHLDSQLGRPYSIRHHLSGNRAEGVHCAEYVTDALMRAHVIKAEQPPRVSPASLLEGLVTGELYAHSSTIEIGEPPRPAPQATGWCHQLWLDTRQCTSSFCTRMQRMFLCR